MKHIIQFKKSLTFKDAVKLIDAGGIGFLAFINTEGVLFGILTDGDVRRAILRNELNLEQIINKKPETMPENASKASIVAKLKQLHRRHMPLIDESGNLVSIFSLDDVEFISKENPVVIMAGGLGSRLGNLTQKIPKPMIHVGGRPILQHLIEQFRDNGFYKFIICLNYKKEIIQDYFDNGYKFGVSIQYIIEEKKLGTAGALSLINKSLISNSFFVVNSDILNNVDLTKLLNFHDTNKAMATMCVKEYTHTVPYGVVETHHNMQIKKIKEKPTITYKTNAGIYILNALALEFIPVNKYFDMPSLFEILLKKKHPCMSFKIDDYWLDIGHIEDLKKANEDMSL